MNQVTPRRVAPNDPTIPQVLDLIKRSFAVMEGRIDPPSSMHRMTEQSISDHCQSGEVWTLGDPVVACIFLTPKPDRLYIGKLAVEQAMRGRGLAWQLISLAEKRARANGRTALELETRIELAENHAAFARMGFFKCAEGSHAGYDRTTFIIMRKSV